MRSYPAILIRPPIGAAEFTDLVAAALDGSDAAAFDEIDDGAGVRAFFQTAAARDAAERTLHAAFPGAEIERLEVSDENWAERSQASLRAIRAGALTVAPPWDVPAEAGDAIVILPSMGFGTGHHATTRLCLIALQNVDVAGASVLDVGTGSGVLALAAARRGARPVRAIDNDPDAIGNAIENKALNALDVEFSCEEIEQIVATRAAFDLLLANLTGAVLVKYAGSLEALTAPGGSLILSGLREEEEGSVLAAFEAGLQARESEEGWVCLVLRREP